MSEAEAGCMLANVFSGAINRILQQSANSSLVICSVTQQVLDELYTAIAAERQPFRLSSIAFLKWLNYVEPAFPGGMPSSRFCVRRQEIDWPLRRIRSAQN